MNIEGKRSQPRMSKRAEGIEENQSMSRDYTKWKRLHKDKWFPDERAHRRHRLVAHSRVLCWECSRPTEWQEGFTADIWNNGS